MLFGLELLRVAFASLDFRFVDARGGSPLAAAGLALAVGIGGFIPYLWHRPAVGRWALGLLAAARLAVQIATRPELDLWLSLIGIAALAALIPSVSSRQGFALAVLFGVVLDRVLMGALETVGLVWRTGAGPIIVVVVLGAFAVATDRPQPVRPAACAAFGPWVALELLMFGNLGFVASLTGWSLRAAAALVAFGGIVSVGAALARGRRWPVAWRPGFTALAFVVLAGVLPLSSGVPAALTLLFASAFAGGILVDLHSERQSGGLWLMALVATLFAVYAPFQYPLGYRWAAVPFVAALAVAAGARRSRPAPAAGGWLTVLVAAVVALPALFAAPQPSLVSPSSSVDEVTVITYNLHQGFASDGSFSLPELADIIEASGADIVALQEVQRGWVTDGEVDMASWLSRRLGMPFVAGPTADRQWGNLLLSRYPIRSATSELLPPSDLPLRRGYIDAEVDLGSTRLRVIVTHFHHIEADDHIRTRQAEALVATLDGRPTVVAGDLNSTPDDEAMRVFRQAGLVDADAGQNLPTSPAANPRERIDYVWVSSDLAVDGVSVIDSTASDHLPVVVRVALPG